MHEASTRSRITGRSLRCPIPNTRPRTCGTPSTAISRMAVDISISAEMASTGASPSMTGFPGILECRKGATGVRAWEGEPGEDHMLFTGEPGGLWRSSGRAPQRLVGVGYSSTMFARSTYYRRTAASHDPEFAFIFDGIGPEEVIGDFGRRGGGASGGNRDRSLGPRSWFSTQQRRPRNIRERRNRRHPELRRIPDRNPRNRRFPAWFRPRRPGVFRNARRWCRIFSGDRSHGSRPSPMTASTTMSRGITGNVLQRFLRPH